MRMNDENTKWFPINFEFFRGFPINSHPGAFGCARKHNFHEGIDIYGFNKQWVNAIRNGTVIRNGPFTGLKAGYPWWMDTDALLVKDSEGYYVYGELFSDLKEGDTVFAGQKIGELTPVLPPDKFREDIPGHSVIMLHLERYSSAYNPEMGWCSWDSRENRPEYLLDPTKDLINILTSKHKPLKFLTL